MPVKQVFLIFSLPVARWHSEVRRVGASCRMALARSILFFFLLFPDEGEIVIS
jgi:hypothetical protein